MPSSKLFTIALIALSLLNGCGGDSSSSESISAPPRLAASIKTNQPLEVKSSFKKDVRELSAKSYPVISADTTTITFAKDPKLDLGRVFIAADRALVARSISKNKDGSVTVGVSQAEFGQVFEQFSLNGKLTFGYDNIDRGSLTPAISASATSTEMGTAVLKTGTPPTDSAGPSQWITKLERAVAADGSQGVKAELKYQGKLPNGSDYEVAGTFGAYNLNVEFHYSCSLTCGSIGGSNDLSVEGRFEHSLSASVKIDTKEVMPKFDVFLYRYFIPIPASGFMIGAYVPVYLRTSVEGELSLVAKIEGAVFVQYSSKGGTAPTSTASAPTAKPAVFMPSIPAAEGTLKVGTYLAAKPALTFLGISLLDNEIETGARATAKVFPGVNTTTGLPTGRMCATGVGRLVADTKFTVGWAHFEEVDLLNLIGFDASLPEIDFAPNCNEENTPPAPISVSVLENKECQYDVFYSSTVSYSSCVAFPKFVISCNGGCAADAKVSIASYKHTTYWTDFDTLEVKSSDFGFGNLALGYDATSKTFVFQDGIQWNTMEWKPLMQGVSTYWHTATLTVQSIGSSGEVVTASASLNTRIAQP